MPLPPFAHYFPPSEPGTIFVAISADFDDALTMGGGETLIEEIETRLRAEFPKPSSIHMRPEKPEDAVLGPFQDESAS